MKQTMSQTAALLKATNEFDLPIAATLVNPKTAEIILSAYDTRTSTKHPLHHAVMNLLRRLPELLPTDPATDKDNCLDEEQYYAEMYDVYVTHEPCTMCCMALIHSRIRRLIFWREMDTGAKEIGWMKGDEEDPTLNHRYMAFSGIEGVLPEEIEIPELDKGVWV
jgi:tRNA-specific adenosine deaminase 3